MFPVDTFRVTLARASAIFQRHSIRFHLTGGIASVVYGEPRMTQDIDFVADNLAIASQLDPFLASLAMSEFLYDSAAVKDAVTTRGMFQLLDIEESLKLDIYVREMVPGELERSESVELFEGEHLPVASRADAAISKLIWVSKGSHKSRRDFRKIYWGADETGKQAIESLADQLQLQTLFAEVLAESDELS